MGDITIPGVIFQILIPIGLIVVLIKMMRSNTGQFGEIMVAVLQRKRHRYCYRLGIVAALTGAILCGVWLNSNEMYAIWALAVYLIGLILTESPAQVADWVRRGKTSLTKYRIRVKKTKEREVA